MADFQMVANDLMPSFHRHRHFSAIPDEERDMASSAVTSTISSNSDAHEIDTVKALAKRYEAERFPTRRDKARANRSWLRQHILPK
jgi:hypothetical protein